MSKSYEPRKRIGFATLIIMGLVIGLAIKKVALGLLIGVILGLIASGMIKDTGK